MASFHSIYYDLGVQSSGVIGFDDLQRVLDSITYEGHWILETLQQRRWNGRPGYPVRALWRAYAAAFLLNLPHTNALIRRLQGDVGLRDLCGFGDVLPHRTTFNRFIRRLSRHLDLVEDALARVTDQFKTLLPDLGDEVAIDSTAVRSHSNPNRKTSATRRPSGASSTRPRPKTVRLNTSSATKSTPWPTLSTESRWPRS